MYNLKCLNNNHTFWLTMTACLLGNNFIFNVSYLAFLGTQKMLNNLRWCELF